MPKGTKNSTFTQVYDNRTSMVTIQHQAQNLVFIKGYWVFDSDSAPISAASPTHGSWAKSPLDSASPLLTPNAFSHPFSPPEAQFLPGRLMDLPSSSNQTCSSWSGKCRKWSSQKNQVKTQRPTWPLLKFPIDSIIFPYGYLHLPHKYA